MFQLMDQNHEAQLRPSQYDLSASNRHLIFAKIRPPTKVPTVVPTKRKRCQYWCPQICRVAYLDVTTCTERARFLRDAHTPETQKAPNKSELFEIGLSEI